MPYGSVKIDSITTSTQTVSVDDLAKKTGQAFTGDLTLNAQADLRFADSDSSNWVALQAPATVASNVTWTLPSADGSSGQALSTNGAGTLGWATFADLTTAQTFSGLTTFSAGANDSAGSFRTAPQNSQSSAYTLQGTDTGKHIKTTSGGITVPSGVFTAGQIVSIYNDSASTITITQGSGTTVRKAGTADTGNRTLELYGVASILCVDTNTFVVTGVGLN